MTMDGTPTNPASDPSTTGVPRPDPAEPAEPAGASLPGAESSGPAPSPAPSPAPPPEPRPARSPELSAEIRAEIDEAMAELGFDVGPARSREAKSRSRSKPHHETRPIPGSPAPAPIRGPRVVEAGREHRHGVVVSVGPTDIFIEFGPKELGVAPRQQWGDDELPTVGSDLEVVVDRYDAEESLYICSRPGAVVKAPWELLEVGQVVEARVTGTNKGGLELDVSGHRAFMPASQVDIERVPDLSVFVGEKLTCQVSQFDRRGKGNIVLSRRDVLQRERQERAVKLRESLQEGQTLEGTVRKIMPFGAFVDIGGLDGLVHLSDLTHERVGYGEKAVAKHVSEGQHVRVQILKIDWDNNRISLGMKQLIEDPFQSAASEIVEGAEIMGKVTRLAEFGAFVEVATGVEGLVHVSEISYQRVRHPSDVLQEDQAVSVKVLKIDPDGRRISLSIKALQQAPVDRRAEEARAKETAAFRRLKEKFGKTGLKGGLS